MATVCSLATAAAAVCWRAVTEPEMLARSNHVVSCSCDSSLLLRHSWNRLVICNKMNWTTNTIFPFYCFCFLQYAECTVIVVSSCVSRICVLSLLEVTSAINWNFYRVFTFTRLPTLIPRLFMCLYYLTAYHLQWFFVRSRQNFVWQCLSMLGVVQPSMCHHLMIAEGWEV